MIPAVLILATSLSVSLGLSCFCGSSPCQTPPCCDSGLYTKDACGCCFTCAQPEEGSCGGPFHTSGTCAAGLRCLRKCECKTAQGLSCVFPFKYRGLEYNACTDVGSENEAVWCATEVDNNGEVIKNTWQDCDEGCPGTGFECNEGFLFNVDGTCINGTNAPGVLRTLSKGPLAVSLDPITDELSQRKAPLCSVSPKSPPRSTCKCATEPITKGLDGNPRGGCVPPLVDHGIEEVANGWCFLINVADPQNPSQDCYEDSQWSATDGRFWSNQACVAESREK